MAKMPSKVMTDYSRNHPYAPMKQFGKLWYFFDTNYSTKEKAEDVARKFRSKGYKAKVTRKKGLMKWVWAVWWYYS